MSHCFCAKYSNAATITSHSMFFHQTNEWKSMKYKDILLDAIFSWYISLSEVAFLNICIQKATQVLFEGRDSRLCIRHYFIHRRRLIGNSMKSVNFICIIIFMCRKCSLSVLCIYFCRFMFIRFITLEVFISMFRN